MGRGYASHTPRIGRLAYAPGAHTARLFDQCGEIPHEIADIFGNR